MTLTTEREQVRSALQALIRAARLRRITTASLLTELAKQFPRLEHDGRLRLLFQQLLDELTVTGLIRPVKSQGEDISAWPALPQQIQRLERQRESFSLAARTDALKGLHPAIKPERIGRWLPAYGVLLPILSKRLWNPQPVVPRNHLSWQLFGDEKRLAVYQSFIHDTLGLSDAQLGIERFAEPLAYRIFQEPPQRFLIVENAETFHIACRKHLFDAVAYGGGKQILSNWTDLEPFQPESIDYFGDWDPEGLRILLTLCERGCPCRPWLQGYYVLWQHKPVADGAGGAGISTNEALKIRALFPELPDTRLQDLREGRRIAQEAWC